MSDHTDPACGPADRLGARHITEPFTADQRIRRARIAALYSWANTEDRTARTAPGTRGLLAKFERDVDPDEQLPPEVRRERAELARRAHMLQLAERSATVRRQRAAKTGSSTPRR